MSITALYVYSATKFKSDVKIESIYGKPFGPGTVELPPGVYRLAKEGAVTATSTSDGAIGDNEIVKHNVVRGLNGTKTTYPDPPARAVLQVGGEQIRTFLQGQGDEVGV